MLEMRLLWSKAIDRRRAGQDRRQNGSAGGERAVGGRRGIIHESIIGTLFNCRAEGPQTLRITRPSCTACGLGTGDWPHTIYVDDRDPLGTVSTL